MNQTDYSNDTSIEIPESLVGSIMARIETQRRKNLRRRFVIGLCVLFVGVVAAVPAWQSFWAELVESGFVQYCSLLFSDFRIVMANWNDYSLGLLESLPALGALEICSVAFIVLLSVKYVVLSEEVVSKSSLIFN